MESESKEKKSKQEPVQNVEKKQNGTGTKCLKCLKITWKIIEKILVIATGALMNSTSTQQGESIPGIAHAISIEV